MGMASSSHYGELILIKASVAATGKSIFNDLKKGSSWQENFKSHCVFLDFDRNVIVT